MSKPAKPIMHTVGRTYQGKRNIILKAESRLLGRSPEGSELQGKPYDPVAEDRARQLYYDAIYVTVGKFPRRN